MARNALPLIAPSRAEMDRRNAPLYAARAAAVRQVDAALTVPGATLCGLYDAACAVRDDERDAPAVKAFRTELMGRLRRA
jgi:hypothetical protein